MGAVVLDQGVKPAQWGFDPGLVEPEFDWFWGRVRFALPFWEGGGNQVHGFGKNPVTGTIIDMPWSNLSSGPALDGGGTDGDGVLLDDDIDIATSGKKFTIICGAFGDQWNQSGIRKGLAGNRIVGTNDGWDFSQVGSNLQFTLFGVAAYNLTTFGTEAEFKTLGLNLDIGTDAVLYVNGIIRSTTSIGTGVNAAGQSLGIWCQNVDGSLDKEWIGDGSFFYMLDGVCSAAEHAQIARDLFGPFRMVDEVGAVLVPVAGPFISDYRFRQRFFG